MNTQAPAFLVVMIFLAVPACTRQESPSPSPPPPIATSASPPPAANPPLKVAPPPLTVDQLRELLLKTEGEIIRKVGEYGRTYRHQAVGTCYGGPAYRLAPADEVLPWLAARLTGKAFDCYLASYFGCRLGDFFALAGVSLHGPEAIPHTTSQIAIIEQTPQRIVADVDEGPSEFVDRGVLDLKELNPLALTDRSRYTLIRDSKRGWLISDRVPNFKDWECRPR